MTLTKRFNKVNASEEIDLEEQGHLILFTAFNTKNTTPSGINVWAYKVGATVFDEVITTADEYLKTNIDYFSKEYPDLVVNDIQSIKLGDKDFKYLEQSLPNDVDQNYIYVCEADGYVIEFNGVTHYDEAKDDIEAFINSINFK